MFYEDDRSQAVPKAKRILVVCAAGYTYGKEVVTLSLIEGLCQQGHEVMVLTSTWSDGKFEHELNRLSIPNRQLPLGFISKQLSWSALWMSLDQLRKLPSLWIYYRRHMRQFNPDVVLHSNFHHTILLLPLLGKKTNVFHVHEVFSPTGFYRHAFNLLNRKINVFVGVSKFVANSLSKLDIPPGKIKYVLNGIATENTSEGGPCVTQQSELGSADEGHIRIGIVGQVSEWKGHEDLIEALRILQRQGESFSCRIFGTGNSEFTVRIKARLEEYGLTDKVEWMGFVKNKDLIYKMIDVCVAPSRFEEPFGMVVAEAAMHGLPVIASRVGGLPEIIVNEDTGYLVDVRSPEQIAEKICALWASPSKRSEMGKSAKTHIQNSFQAQRMVMDMETVLAQAVNGLGER
jgi:glycosyltransferase involved in cell wall biosynthesis